MNSKKDLSADCGLHGSGYTGLSSSKCRCVDADEFSQLLLSTRKLLRDDGKEFGRRALIDPATGDRYVVDEYALCEALARI